MYAAYVVAAYDADTAAVVADDSRYHYCCVGRFVPCLVESELVGKGSVKVYGRP